MKKKAEQQKAASKMGVSAKGASIVPTKDRIEWPYVVVLLGRPFQAFAIRKGQTVIILARH